LPQSAFDCDQIVVNIGQARSINN